MASRNSSQPSLFPWRWIFKRVDCSASQERAELVQAKIRIIMIQVFSVYTVIMSLPTSRGNTLEPWAMTIFAYYGAYTPPAILLLYLVHRYPGHYPARRVIAMIADFVAISFTIIVGTEVMLPLYSIIVWITVGNGLRYGRPYMTAAAVMAQTSLIVVTAMTPYWQTNPSLIVTLSMISIIIPFYASSLLRSNETALQKAEDASIAKSRFLAQASHDLRQPVHAIGLFLNSLKQTSLGVDQRLIVDRIDRSVRGVAGLFKSLLDISTLESGALHPKYEPVVLGQLFFEIAQQNHDSAGWADIDLRFWSTKYTVVVDRGLLLTMLQNLVSNAIKYAPGRSVLLGCRRKGDLVSIFVCDRGPGIAPEHLPHLFEEFYQIRNLGDPDIQGVGLGLSIVQRLARLMDLDVKFESRQGHGTMVSICGLKLSNSSADASPHYAEANFIDPFSGFRILLVEDDRDVLDATADLLRGWGCEVLACNGIPLAPVDCDLIITDFDIGGNVTGADCINSIRHQNGRFIPAIMMTGHDEVRVTQIIDDESIPVLKKPVRPAELRSTINTARVRFNLGI